MVYFDYFFLHDCIFKDDIS